MKPILVLLNNKFLTISLDPGFRHAAEIKNAETETVQWVRQFEHKFMRLHPSGTPKRGRESLRGALKEKSQHVIRSWE